MLYNPFWKKQIYLLLLWNVICKNTLNISQAFADGGLIYLPVLKNKGLNIQAACQYYHGYKWNTKLETCSYAFIS